MDFKISFNDKTVDAIKERSKEIIGSGQDLINKFDELSKWDSVDEVVSNMKDISTFVLDLVLIVELACEDLQNKVDKIESSDKLKAAATLIDDFISLPWYLEPADVWVFEMLLSQGVSFLNELLGDNWNLEKIRETIVQGKSFLKVVANAIKEL